MRTIVLVWFLLVPIACGGSDSTKALSREDFCQEWAVRACSDAVVSACQAADAASCRTKQQDFCSSVLPAGYSAQHADACLGAVSAAYADADLTGSELRTVIRFGAPCNRIVKGSSARGEACSNDHDCDGSAGFECIEKGAQGTCQIPEEVAAGLRCAAPQQVCSSGFYCDGANCIEAKSPGDTCANDSECGAAGSCGGDGVCVARLPVDSACSSDGQCISGVCYAFAAADQTCIDRLRLSRSEPICANLR